MNMSVQKWLLRKIKYIDKERLNKHLNIIMENSGKSKLWIEFDILRSFLTYGTGYTDYFRGNFVNATREEKKTFVTAKTFYKLLGYLNNPKYIVLLNDKLVFNRLFSEYLNRDYIDLKLTTEEEFTSFLKEKQTVFAKNPTGEAGHGISKIIANEVGDFGRLYNELKSNGQLLVEEAIVQCDELNEINPCSVCSYRIVTLYKDNKAHIIGNAMRINQGEAQVIGCTNDLYFSLDGEGYIDSNVIDDYGNIYESHPMTGKKFSEVHIPYMKQAREIVTRLAERIPEVRYIGWDIAFTPNGPSLVEGNEYPGYGLLQFYQLKGKKTGHLQDIRDVLGDELDTLKL